MPERTVTRDAANCLRIDHAAVEVIRALDIDSVPSLLLKGPVLTEWLFGGDRNRRPYVDVDLLVPSHRTGDAQRVLEGIGFTCTRPFDGVLPHGRPRHAATWFRGRDGVAVDLHRSIHGAERVAPDRLWSAARCPAASIGLLGERVAVPGLAFRALHVVLHVRPKDAPGTRAWGDLTVALDAVPLATWRCAADLAAELGLSSTMGALLGRHPRGRSLAGRLGLSCAAPLAMRWEYDRSSEVTRFLAEVLEAPGIEGLLLAKEKVLPPAAYRAAHPTAGRSRAVRIRRLAPLLRPVRLVRGARGPGPRRA